MGTLHNDGKKYEGYGKDSCHTEQTVQAAYQDFVAFIRTRRGHFFHQEYENIESFREEMQEHRDDVVWGVLLRRETGNPVDIFFTGERQKIGLVDTEPKNTEVTPEGLSPQQAALRDAAISHFKSNKIRAYISEQLIHINPSQQLGGELRKLFDNNGRPPVNAPLEDIVAEREKAEAQIKWLEAICTELRNNLVKIKEVEDFAFKLVARATEDT